MKQLEIRRDNKVVDVIKIKSKAEAHQKKAEYIKSLKENGAKYLAKDTVFIYSEKI